jgi:hypothetical protein
MLLGVTPCSDLATNPSLGWGGIQSPTGTLRIPSETKTEPIPNERESSPESKDGQ